jgi:hypothetical protein
MKQDEPVIMQFDHGYELSQSFKIANQQLKDVA